MEDMKSKIKEEICNFVNSKNFVPCSKEKLVAHFSSYYDKSDINEVINEMLEEYDVVMTSKKNIQSAASSSIFKGIVTGVNDEYIYVAVDGFEDDCRVSRKSHELVYPKDTVVIKSYDEYGNNGELVKSLNTNKDKICAGEIVVEGYNTGKYVYYIKPISKRLGYKLRLNNEECSNIVDGHMVSFTLESTKNGVIPHINKILGHKTDADSYTLALAIEYEIPVEFSQEAIEQAENTPNEVSVIDKADRVDCTGEDHLIITIDGADTKDRDDAFEITKEGDTIHVIVHISDVAHYVPMYSPIFNDAVERATSCYPIDCVIPMLPRKLSNGICSLDPNVERLAISYSFDITENGEAENFGVERSVIKSSKAFTYDEVQEILDGNPQTIEENQKYLELINLAKEASDRLSERKEKNGELKLESREAKVVLDENRKLKDIEVRKQRKAERIIEDLMVGTNESGAIFVNNMGLPCIFRNEEAPELEKLEENFIPLCNSLKITPRFRNDNFAYEYKRIMSNIEDETVKVVLSNAFLRCMPKAIYEASEHGHFGLALEYYAQLTSPIRRLGDLINQHIMHKILNFDKQPELYNEICDMYPQLVEYAKQASIGERRGDKFERERMKRAFAEYMESHIGEEYVGIVSGFNKNGMYVQLPNTIEGLISFKSMSNNDSYNYDENKKMVVGKRSGDKFVLGTPVEIKVKKATKSEGQIDFSYVQRLDKKMVNKL